MADDEKPRERQWFSDKTKYVKLMEEIDAKAGVVFDPAMTAERLQQMMLEQGVRPEDNALSRDIIRHKYPDEEDDGMAAVPKPGEKQWFVDKTKFRALIEESNAKAGIVSDPDVTIEKVRQMMLAQGIRPEDNIFSRDIIRAKYPDETEE